MSEHGVTVRFNDVDEFIAELAKGPATIDSALRVTVEYRPTQMSPAIQHISVVAGALRKCDGVLQAHSAPTLLRRLLGQGVRA